MKIRKRATYPNRWTYFEVACAAWRGRILANLCLGWNIGAQLMRLNLDVAFPVRVNSIDARQDDIPVLDAHLVGIGFDTHEVHVSGIIGAVTADIPTKIVVLHDLHALFGIQIHQRLILPLIAAGGPASQV